MRRLNDQAISCRSCVFMHPDARTNSGGQCRRHAPLVTINASNKPRTTWPLVWDDYWCGDHATLEELEEVDEQ